MGERPFREARILIVDDEDANVRYLERVLRQAGVRWVTTTTHAREAVALFQEVQPDLVLLDLFMPECDGVAVLEDLRAVIPNDSYVPIVLLSAPVGDAVKRRALACGARDFLGKPFDAVDVTARVANLIEIGVLRARQLVPAPRAVVDTVRDNTRDLKESQVEILERIAFAIEFRNDQTGQHPQRVGRMAAIIARGMGLSVDQVDLIRRAAPLHDVGKVGIPDYILLKPDALSVAEFDVIKTHTTVGARILAGGNSDLIQMAHQIALSHHEHWDGSGYPQGLAGDRIPIAGRIVALADVYDALRHRRPYKEPWPLDDVIAEILAQRGHQFDPRVVDAFLRVRENGGPVLVTEVFEERYASFAS